MRNGDFPHWCGNWPEGTGSTVTYGQMIAFLHGLGNSASCVACQISECKTCGLSETLSFAVLQLDRSMWDHGHVWKCYGNLHIFTWWSQGARDGWRMDETRVTWRNPALWTIPECGNQRANSMKTMVTRVWSWHLKRLLGVWVIFPSFSSALCGKRHGYTPRLQDFRKNVSCGNITVEFIQQSLVVAPSSCGSQFIACTATGVLGWRLG